VETVHRRGPGHDFRVLPSFGGPVVPSGLMQQVTNRPSMSDSAEISDLGIADALVFHANEASFRLVGGIGRGAGWADLVAFRMADEPIVRQAWQSGSTVRIDTTDAVRVVGPYWARHAVVIPVGREHLVVLGGGTPITAADALLVRAAARVVSETNDVPAEKLLADELEVVHALRSLTAYRPETVRDTARHVAVVAARALSCDVAAIQVQHGESSLLEAIRLKGGGLHDSDAETAGPDAAPYLRDASAFSGPLVEQEVGPDPRVWMESVVSRLTLPIGGAERLGALALGHDADRPRGFTTLCQRIGRAIAEASELLLSQALAREQLTAEHEQLRVANTTDPLTGVGNRARWDNVVASFQKGTLPGGPACAVLSVDVDHLKRINDGYGHAAGDAVIRGAANVLLECVRDGDFVTRVGGDEFLVLLPGSDVAGARRVARRISNNLRKWRVTEHGLVPAVSVGWATCPDGDVAAAVAAADRVMYRAKRRHAKAGTALAETAELRRSTERRTSRAGRRGSPESAPV
jgi:diguanylate cyclase (GGDEF)-like protein